MTDHTAPERIWIDPRGGRWVSADDAQEDHGDIEYIRADLHRAEAKALRAAADVCEGIRHRIANGPMPEGARFDYEQSIRALIAAEKEGKP